MRAWPLLGLGLALGCSDTGGTPVTPGTEDGGTSGGGTAALAGATSSGGSGGNGAGSGRGGSSAGSAVGGGAGSGGTTSNAGTSQNGGSTVGGAGTTSSGGRGGSSGQGDAANAGTAAASGEAQGGKGGVSGAGGDAGVSSAGRGGAAGAGGVGGNAAGAAGGGSTIDTTNVTTACPGAVPAGVTSSWCSCEQWGEKASGSITYYNNIWGSGPGPQCIWLADGGMWGVAAKHPNTSGIKSYPNVSLSPQKAISSINTYTSSFDVIMPTGGAYDTAYDLWVKGTTSARIEIMLWVTFQGGVQPIAKSYDASGAVADAKNVTVGGHTWNVFYGSNGANDVASFVRTSITSSGSVDIKAILSWLIANNHSSYAVFTDSYTLDQVQFGTEISSDSGTGAYVTKSFAVTSN
ncbi:MAG TPA: hypothetical protein VNN72_11290 [Polyangiaceae bacterium]|nr:hypothetical protein [Polyangiaceae bacterium]